LFYQFKGNWWTAEVQVNKEIAFDYKFFIAHHDSPSHGNIKWEQGPNRSANIKGYARSSIEICNLNLLIALINLLR